MSSTVSGARWWRRMRVWGLLGLLAGPVAAGTAEAQLVAAVLPSSRSVQVGTPATAFAAIINAGEATATACSVALASAIPATLGYQTTDALTNAPTGDPDTPVDIPGGQAQSFVLSLTPTAPIAPTDVAFTFDCTNTTPATVQPGINTLTLSASADPVPDIVALAATAGPPGVLVVANTGAFAVATINLGAAGEVTVTPDIGAGALPLTLTICETEPGTGLCKAAPTPDVALPIGANATPTFGVFGAATADVPANPATNRVHVRFKQAGVPRGATSVATEATCTIACAPGSGQVQTPLASDTGYAMTYAGSGTATGNGALSVLGIDVRHPVNATFDAQGRLTKWVSDVNDFTRENERPELGTQAVSELAGDALSSVGRWNGGSSAGKYFSLPTFTTTANRGLHYAIGKPGTLPAALPLTGLRTYTFLAATRPTYRDGHTAPGSLSGVVAVDFAAKAVGFDLTFTMPDGTFTFTSPGGGPAYPAGTATSWFALNGIQGFSGSLPGSFFDGLFVGETGDRMLFSVRFGREGGQEISVAGMLGGGDTTASPPPPPPQFGSLALTQAAPEWGGSFDARTSAVTPLTGFKQVEWHTAAGVFHPFLFVSINDGGTVTSVSFVGTTSSYTADCVLTPAACTGVSADTAAKTVTFSDVSIPGSVNGLPAAPLGASGTLTYP